LAISSGVRPLAGLLINCMVPPSPPRKSARTPVGLSVILYAPLGAGCDTEKDPSGAVKRGLAAKGSPVGGCPQSGGQTYRAGGL
jgi:hypothetical protein